MPAGRAGVYLRFEGPLKAFLEFEKWNSVISMEQRPQSILRKHQVQHAAGGFSPCRRCVGTLWWWADRPLLDSKCRGKLLQLCSRISGGTKAKRVKTFLMVTRMWREVAILTGPSDSDCMASSHTFLFAVSFFISAFCSLVSLYSSTFTFLGVLAGELLDDSVKEMWFNPQKQN